MWLSGIITKTFYRFIILTGMPPLTGLGDGLSDSFCYRCFAPNGALGLFVGFILLPMFRP